jgi:hypothetical protein
MELIFIDILKSFGPTIAGIAFFVWRDWKREDRMRKELEDAHAEVREVRKWIQDSLIALVSRMEVNIVQLTTALAKCPCREGITTNVKLSDAE